MNILHGFLQSPADLDYMQSIFLIKYTPSILHAITAQELIDKGCPEPWVQRAQGNPDQLLAAQAIYHRLLPIFNVKELAIRDRYGHNIFNFFTREEPATLEILLRSRIVYPHPQNHLNTNSHLFLNGITSDINLFPHLIEAGFDPKQINLHTTSIIRLFPTHLDQFKIYALFVQAGAFWPTDAPNTMLAKMSKDPKMRSQITALIEDLSLSIFNGLFNEVGLIQILIQFYQDGYHIELERLKQTLKGELREQKKEAFDEQWKKYNLNLSQKIQDKFDSLFF